ncbi:MAG: hypothetical protein F6K00_18065 [Leptolyngbya sp. SIOISBB]|nr:hypothetical protein [Leptolyngbya sp. SIOISBB]
MTSHQGQLQALITEIEALLGRAAPKLPWMVSGEAGEQRRVMEQALAYLRELQGTSAPGWGLVTRASGAIAPTTATADPNAGNTPAAESQQMLQALLQEMQYLRAQMVQPLTSEVIALQQQRETLKNEVRQLEQQRLQQATVTPASQPHPDWISDVVEQLRASLLTELTPPLRALQSTSTTELAFHSAADQNLLTGSDSLPQLTPQQRLEQLRQIQSQTDGMLLKLDANLRAVFESLDQSIQSYCDTLNQGLDAMHGLGQQGEFIFRTFINHLAEQLQEEGSEIAERLASQQELARLQGQTDSSEISEEVAAHDELMDEIVDLDDVELEDLDEFALDADLDLEEEVTLFQLDEGFDDWSDEEMAAEDSDSILEHDAGEQTIVQTEPIAWTVATGQASEPPADNPLASDDEPTVAYTEEIDALYDNLFGPAGEPIAAAPPAPNNEVDGGIDEQLLNTDLSGMVTDVPAVDPPAIADVVPVPEASDTSLDLDFLLEADAAIADSPTVTNAADDDIAPSLESLLGAEMAAELSPDEMTGSGTSDTITSLTELLPESEQDQALRQTDPFTAFDEAEDTFIPAPPDENLLDTESEVARTQVDLTLDDETLGILSSDLSQLEDNPLDETLEASRVSNASEDTWDLIAPELTLDMSDPSLEEAVTPTLPDIPETPGADTITLPFDQAASLETAAALFEEDSTTSSDEVPNNFAELFPDTALERMAAPEADNTLEPASPPPGQDPGAINEEPETATATDSSAEPSDPSAAPVADADTPDKTEAAISDAYTDFKFSELFAPEANDQETSAADRNLENAADSLELLDFEPVVAEPSDEGEEIDLLTRLDLDDLELFDESALRQGVASDLPPAVDLDLSAHPTSEPTETAELLDDFFGSPDPTTAADPLTTGIADDAVESEPPSLDTLDTFFDEPSTPPSEGIDTDLALTPDTSGPANLADQDTLMSALFDEPTSASSIADTLSIEAVFGDADTLTPSDSGDSSTAEETALTLENAFADTEPAAAPDESSSRETLEDFAAAMSNSPSDLSDEADASLVDLFASTSAPQASEPSLTLDDLDFASESSDGTDSSFDLTPSTDELDSNLTLESDLFEAVEETADDVAAGAETKSTAPELIDSVGSDDLSFEGLSDSFDESTSTPGSTANEIDSLDFGELDVNFSLESGLAEQAEETALTVDDVFSELGDAVAPAISEATDFDLASESAGATGIESPPDSASTATTEHGVSALAIESTPDAGIQIVSAAPNDALMQSLADLPDDEVAVENATPMTDTPSSTLDLSGSPAGPESPNTSGSVSGSAADGYRLSFARNNNPAAVVDQALTDTGDVTTEVTAATASEDSNRLQKEYGRRLTSLTDMVAATSLPFTTAANLSNIPDPGQPIAFNSETSDEAIAAAPPLPDSPSLPLAGSVEEGFAIALPEPEIDLAERLADLPDADPNLVETDLSDAAAATTESSSAPLTNEELASLFPSEEVADDVASTPAGDAGFPVAEDTSGVELFATNDDTQPTDALEPEDLDIDLPLVGPDETSLLTDAAIDEDVELSRTLADLDLSMEEIPESEIASDEAFQAAFEDDTSPGNRPEDIGILSEEAISDLDALSTGQEFMPADWETELPEAPTLESAPELAEEVDPTSSTIAAADEGVFASSGMLATLGDDDADGAIPETEAATDAPAEEWFLGIDLGTSGLSAVLMEHHSGSAHPLCWLSETAAEDVPGSFRIPAVVTVSTPYPEAGSAFELRAVGQAAVSQPAAMSGQQMLHTLRPFLRAGIPHQRADGTTAPQVQWSDTSTLPLQHMLSAVTALLQLISHPADAGLKLTAIGLETGPLEAALANLQGIVIGLPTNWSDTYCFNLREAILATGLVESPNQVFFVEEAIAAILSGLPDPSIPAPPANRSATQALYQCHWQGGTVVVSGGATCTEVGIVDLPQPLDAVSREDFQLRNLAYGGDALDLDIICQLLVPPERRQPLGSGSRRPPNRGWGWQAALPEVANARWTDLELDAFDLPQLAEPDAGARQRLRQHLEASRLGQSLLEAARHLKLILQHQNQYQLELADQSWRVLRRDLESRVLVPYIQRINQHVNGLLSQTGLPSQGINQVICTGGNASFSTIAKWLRQKFPNATIIQDTYPSDRPQTCSRVAYGLVNLCRYPQVLDVPRHQYSDYFLLHEMMRILPDAPLPFDGILHLLEEQGINVQACQPRIAALLEGHLPPGLLPDVATRELLSRETVMSQPYQDLAAGSLFSRQTRNIYVVNTAQRDRLLQHLAALIHNKQQSLAEPLFAQLVSV